MQNSLNKPTRAKALNTPSPAINPRDDLKPQFPRVLRPQELPAYVKLSLSHIYALARKGEFPKPRKLTENTSVWLESEVLEWMNERIGLNG